MDMSPAKIAEQLGPNEFIKLCSVVDTQYKGQKFGVIRITRTNGLTVVIETQDNVRHVVNL
jgi:hypothetical protein